MVSFQTDPEWFKGPYAYLWKPHADKVKALYDELIERFPALEKSISVGLGADSSELIRIPPHQKDEPDLNVYYEYKLLCHIEVSGTDSRNVRVPPNDIWIRPGKIALGVEKEKQGEPYWFYMVYTNNVCVLRATEAEPYRTNTLTASPYGKREVYSKIPHTVSQPKDNLFKWIEEQIS